MDIITYRKRLGISQAEFAAKLTAGGVATSQSLVAQWENEQVRITPERAIHIEHVTRRLIKRQDLRRDLWPKRTRAPNRKVEA